MSEQTGRPLVSIVVPLLDERPVLADLCARLGGIVGFPELRADLEFVFVDDGSSDGSLEVLEAWAAGEPRARVLSLTRNFGQEAAIAAGLDHCSGDAVVVMDADLQDPPELIPALVERWLGGAEVVHARRSSRRGDPASKRLLAWLFWRIAAPGSGPGVVTDAGEFRLVDRRLVDGLRTAEDRGRFLRWLACWAGGRQESVLFDRDERKAGSTKYGLARQAALALAGMTAMTAFPLRVMGAVGGLLVLAGIATLAAVLVLRGGETSTVLLFSGVSLGCTGSVLAGLWLVGEYLHAMGRKVRGLPLYIVSRKIGFEGYTTSGPDGARTGGTDDA